MAHYATAILIVLLGLAVIFAGLISLFSNDGISSLVWHWLVSKNEVISTVTPIGMPRVTVSPGEVPRGSDLTRSTDISVEQAEPVSE